MINITGQRNERVDFADMKLNPKRHFDIPADVICDMELRADQKVIILEQWKNDACLREVADGENMSGDANVGDELKKVSEALRAAEELAAMER